MTCPTPDQLLGAFSSTLDDAETSRIFEHAQHCAACRNESASLKQLADSLQRPLDAPTIEVDEVVRVATRDRRPWKPVLALAASFALFAAGTLLWSRTQVDDFTARGSATPWTQRVSVRALVSPSGLIEEGATLTPQSLFTAAAFGVTAKDHLETLVFLIDSHHSIHWIAPQWTDEAQIPASVKVPAEFSRSEPGAVWTLNTSVKFDDLALGPAQLVSIVSASPISVLNIERLADKSATALQRAYPHALLRFTHCTIAERP